MALLCRNVSEPSDNLISCTASAFVWCIRCTVMSKHVGGSDKCNIMYCNCIYCMDLRYSLIHFAVCLTTGPKPLPKRALHRCEHPLLPLGSSSSFLRLLPHLPVTSIPRFIVSSSICRRRQFLREM
jgi:hypothetical protein